MGSPKPVDRRLSRPTFVNKKLYGDIRVPNLKLVRGQSSTVVHTGIGDMSRQVLDFTNGELLKKYFDFIETKYGKGRVRLPDPVVTHIDDDFCIIVESFRHSSKPNEVLRLVQRFVQKVDTYYADPKSEADQTLNPVAVAFWTIPKSEVPKNDTNDYGDYFNERNLTLVDDRYSECGKIHLSFLPHNQTSMICDLEIGYDSKSMEGATIMELIESWLDIAKVANEHFDRSDEVDEAVSSNFINCVMPEADNLKVGEINQIERCKKNLGWGTVYHMHELNDDERREVLLGTTPRRAWAAMPGVPLNGVVQKFLSENDKNVVTVKGIVAIHEKLEIILAYIFHTKSNERVSDHVRANGNLERTWRYDNKSHTCYLSGEVKSPPGLTNRRFSCSLVWKKGWDGNPNVYVLAMLPEKVSEDAKDKKTNSSGAVTGSTTALYIFETLADRITRVTQYQQTDLKLAEGAIGDMLSNLAAKYSLGTLDALYIKFQRMGTTIDQEVRSQFISMISNAPTGDDQTQLMIARCLKLGDISAGNFTELKSDSYRIKYFRKRDYSVSRNVAIGKSVTEVDASAETVLAWRWDWDSNEKMAIHRGDRRSVSRSVVEKISANCVIVETTKKFPFPFKNREFVVQTVWSKLKDGSFLYCWESVKDTNYMYEGRAIRADSRGFIRIVPLPGNCRCKFEIVRRIDVGGRIPDWVFNLKIKHGLSTTSELHKAFDRSCQLDLEEHEALEEGMKRGRAEKYETDEDKIIEDAKLRFGVNTEAHLKTIESPDPLVIMKSGFSNGEANIVGWAETVVDASVEACASWAYISDSREKMESFEKYGGLERVITKISNHSQVNRTVYDLVPLPSVKPREWLAKTVWKLDSDAKFIVASSPIINEELGPSNFKFIRATMHSMLLFERLEAVGGLPRTKVIYWAQVNLGGSIPKTFVNMQVANNLMHLSEMRMFFDKSALIDQASRDSIVLKMRENQDYTIPEQKQIDDGLSKLTEFDSLPNKNNVGSASPLAKSEVAQKDGERNAYGKVSTVIRASPEQIIAYQMDFMAGHLRKAETINKRIIEEPNSHNKLVYMIKVIPGPVSNRDLVMRFVWKKIGDGCYAFVINDEIHDNFPANKGDLIRALYPTTLKLNALGDDETAIDYLVQLDFGVGDKIGGKLVSHLMNLFLPKNLKSVVEMQQYFQQLRPLNLLDKQDAVAMAEVFVLKFTKEEKHKAKDSKRSLAFVRVQSVISSHVALKQFAKENPWFSELMTGIVTNKMRRRSENVKTRLACLSELEGRAIGNSLASLLIASTSSDLAVDGWISKFKAMQELEKSVQWFRPMMDRIAMRLHKLTTHREKQLDIKTFTSSTSTTLEDKAFFSSIEPHLGVAGGKRNAALCICCAFTTCAIICSIPTSKPFTGGVENNLVHLSVIFPLNTITAMNLAFAGGSVFFKISGICEGLTRREALILRVKVYLLSVGSWLLCQMMFLFPLQIFWIYPLPWITILSPNITVLLPLLVTYKYLKNRYKTQVPSARSLLNIAIMLLITSAFVAALPLTTGAYMFLSKTWQPAIIVVVGGYRTACGFLIEYIGFNSRTKVDIRTVILMGLIVDLVYEVYASTLLTGAKSGISLVLPAIMDLGGNISLMVYIWIFPVSQGTQFAFLVALALREMVEMVASAGVMGIICSIWYFNRYDYYMMDVATDIAIRNAALMSVGDFFMELTVFVIFDRMVNKLWKVSLLDLGQAYVRSIGKAETYCLVCGFSCYLFMFMNYHYGCDYFFDFEWMTEENLAIAELNDGSPTWCDIMQGGGFSCYSYDYTPMSGNATMSFNETVGEN